MLRLLLFSSLLVLVAASCTADDTTVTDAGDDASVDAPICDAEPIPTTVVIECAAEPQTADNCHGAPGPRMYDAGHESDGFPVGCRAVLPERSEAVSVCGPTPIYCYCMGAAGGSPGWVCPV